MESMDRMFLLRRDFHVKIHIKIKHKDVVRK